MAFEERSFDGSSFDEGSWKATMQGVEILVRQRAAGRFSMHVLIHLGECTLSHSRPLACAGPRAAQRHAYDFALHFAAQYAPSPEASPAAFDALAWESVEVLAA